MTSAEAVGPEARPRSSLQLVRDPVVGPFFFGKLISTLGIWVHNIAAAIVVFELTSSALLVGAVRVSQLAPQILLTPWSRSSATDGGSRLRPRRARNWSTSCAGTG